MNDIEALRTRCKVSNSRRRMNKTGSALSGWGLKPHVWRVDHKRLKFVGGLSMGTA